MRKELKDEEFILIFDIDKQFFEADFLVVYQLILTLSNLTFCFLTKCQFPKPEFYLNRKTDMSQTFIRTQFLAKLFPQLCLCHWNGNCDLFVILNCQKGHNCDLFTSYEQQKGHDLFTSYEQQKGHNCDLSVTFLLVINDIVNDKKGHNFMNDKTYWFSGNFCLVWKKYWKSSSFFCQTGSATILNFYLKSRSQEVGCVF